MRVRPAGADEDGGYCGMGSQVGGETGFHGWTETGQVEVVSGGGVGDKVFD